MEHPIAQAIKKERLHPLLDPKETLEVYFAAVHHKGGKGPSGHAFAAKVFPSSGRDLAPIKWRSLDEESHNQRGNLGAVLSIFEWLSENARSNDVLIHTAEKYIATLPDNVSNWAEDQSSSVQDLYQLLLPYFQDCLWQHVRIKWTSAKAQAKRREPLKTLAKRELNALIESVEIDR